jgi:hypothetical protein
MFSTEERRLFVNVAFGDLPVRSTRESVEVFDVASVRRPAAGVKNCLRQKSNFASRFSADSTVQSSREKYRVSVFRKFMIWSRRPASVRGAYALSSRHVRRGCGGRDGLARRAMPTRTAKSCGPGLPTTPARSTHELGLSAGAYTGKAAIGWIEYYGRFTRAALGPILRYVNQTIEAWMMRKFKRFMGRKAKARPRPRTTISRTSRVVRTLEDRHTRLVRLMGAQ